MMDTKDELKPCPKCQGPGALHMSSDGDAEWVKCADCGHEGTVTLTTRMAIAAWNTRPQDELIAELVEALGSAPEAGDYIGTSERKSLNRSPSGVRSFVDAHTTWTIRANAALTKARATCSGVMAGGTMTTPEQVAEIRAMEMAESVGFIYWPGGNEPPADWDGGPYLCRDGKTCWMRGYDWRHGTGCWNPTADWDRIGYKTAHLERTRHDHT